MELRPRTGVQAGMRSALSPLVVAAVGAALLLGVVAHAEEPVARAPVEQYLVLEAERTSPATIQPGQLVELRASCRTSLSGTAQARGPATRVTGAELDLTTPSSERSRRPRW